MKESDLTMVVSWFNERGMLPSDVNYSTVKEAMLAVGLDCCCALSEDDLTDVKLEIQRVKVDLCF
ncbi:hypothetical protein QPB19_003510 [Vibrio cholerae]|nr:hypothetical protein [Vibrio cholerae]